MKLHGAVGGVLFMLLGASLSVVPFAAGCSSSSSAGGTSSSGSSSGGGSSGGTTEPGCTADTTVSCSQGDGYSCDSGSDPESESGGSLSCSDPVDDPSGSGSDYCCFEWTGGTSTCTPDDDLSAECTTAGSFGFQCDDPSDDPTSLDSSLSCSSGVSDPDGSHTDFCCQ